jgi:uroporphyrinogen-III decarboxylase
MLEAGAEGGYIIGPAHSIEGDVPLENMLAMLAEIRNQ